MMNSCAYAAFAAATTCSVVASSVPYLMLSSMVPWNSRHSWLTRPIWNTKQAVPDAFQQQLCNRAASPSQPQIIYRLILLYGCNTCSMQTAHVQLIQAAATYHLQDAHSIVT